jgi:RNA polymerase sigma-70 factor, ECF subfamily
MPATGAPGDFDPAVRRMIAAKARRLVGQYGLRSQDRPDIEQDLAARFAARLEDYDPTRGTLVAFAAMVIGQAAANLLRERRAGKRTPPRRSPVAADDALDPTAGPTARRRDLELDVAAVLARLPAEARDLARALMAASVSEVSRETGIPRTTLYGRLDELRSAFDRAGLRDYA